MLGYGLLAAAAGIALLTIVWLMVSGVEAGGAVLGLLLLFVLAGPLAGAGYYVLARARTERLDEQQFSGKRRILEADRLFRRELIARLRQLAATNSSAGQHLNSMAQSVASSAPTDEAAWYASIQLDDSKAALLRQYDDLVWERVNWLRDHETDSPQAVTEAVKQLQVAIDQRTDLLIRGRSAPAVSPAALQRAGSPTNVAVGLISLGDAISYDGIDYVVEGVATGFSNGQTSKLLHLIPSGPGASEHWLLVTPGGLELAWLNAVESAVEHPGAPTFGLGSLTLPLVSASSATLEVQTSSGSTPALLVNVWTYRSERLVALVEQWPDGALESYAGTIVAPADLEIWPSVKATPV
jgi:hypothetical protein